MALLRRCFFGLTGIGALTQVSAVGSKKNRGKPRFFF
jgi:hypothetical protein